jgi:ADP-ribosylation factor-like protein 1
LLAMGLWFSKLLSVFGDKEARILVLGLDNAGKTTILCKSDLRSMSSSVPLTVLERHC